MAYADCSHGCGVVTGVCLSVCMFIRTISQKTAAARITKLDIEIFHHESWKLIYFGVKRSKLKVMRHRKTVSTWLLHSCECWFRLVVVDRR